MLFLSGLSLKANVTGTVTIFAIPPKHKGFGGTSQKRIVVENDRGDMFIVEDQIIEVDTKGVFVVNPSDEQLDRADAETEARNG